MGAHSFSDLRQHIGHDICCVGYGYPEPQTGLNMVNVAVECKTCSEVLLDFNAEDATE